MKSFKHEGQSAFEPNQVLSKISPVEIQFWKSPKLIRETIRFAFDSNKLSESALFYCLWATELCQFGENEDAFKSRFSSYHQKLCLSSQFLFGSVLNSVDQ